jgi:5-methylcytosine-specific restriction endonuclease McrA
MPQRNGRKAAHPLACLVCGQTFFVDRDRITTAKYCSRECQGLSQRGPRKPCARCGVPIPALPSAPRRQFCSITCRDADGRATFVCEHCGGSVSMKKSMARDRRFCSRTCMQAAWRCGYCAKLRPESRRDLDYCSTRCELLIGLEAEAEETGIRQSVCGRCQRILPGSDFHREKATRSGLSNRCKDCTRGKYEATKDQFRRRRYVSKSAGGGQLVPFTSEQRAARFSMWGGRCWICGIDGASAEDHVKPISKGGWHCLSNLRPVCLSCNARKRASWPLTGDQLRPNFSHPDPRAGNDLADRRAREPRVSYTCPVCGTTSERAASDARNRKTCSVECGRRGRTLPMAVLACRHCGRDFAVHHSTQNTRRYCSHRCATAHSRGRRLYPPGLGQQTLW